MNTIVDGQASYDPKEVDDGFRPTPYLRATQVPWPPGTRRIEQRWHNSETGADEWRPIPKAEDL